MILLLNETHL